MARINRRKFIYSTALLAGLPGVLSSYEAEKPAGTKETPKKMLVGVISAADNPEKDLKIVRDLGFPVCQLNVEKFSPELARRVSSTLEKYGLKATSLICSGPGIDKYTFNEGPSTIGLVPRENRVARVARFKQGIDFCKAAGIPAIQNSGCINTYMGRHIDR